jgi:SAV_6107-like HEPN
VTRLQHTPFDLPAATHSYLERAAASLREAMTSSEVPQRYASAHVAALRATAALLAARARPALTPRRGRQKNAWVLLAEVAPELAEWAAFFSAGAAKRAAAESGSRRAVTEREADDLVRDADRFLGLVEESLGMTRHVPLQEHLPTVSRRSIA